MFISLLWSTTALTAIAIASPAARPSAQISRAGRIRTPPRRHRPPTPAHERRCSANRGCRGPDDTRIVVTGLRRSLQSARNIKRNSDQIVDAIVAEDIGKLPDIAVSDTAARIPGVQVDARARRSRAACLLRGLDRTYYTTTYNGREIFTAETRSVALAGFPVGRDRRARGIQDLDREPDRTRPRRSGQRPLAPAVRLQGLRGRRIVLGLYPRQVARVGTPTATA